MDSSSHKRRLKIRLSVVAEDDPLWMLQFIVSELPSHQVAAGSDSDGGNEVADEQLETIARGSVREALEVANSTKPSLLPDEERAFRAITEQHLREGRRRWKGGTLKSLAHGWGIVASVISVAASVKKLFD